VLHAAVSGITAVIDASGKVERRTTLFHNAVTTGTVTTTTGQTPFVRWGAWIDWVSLAVLAGGTVLGLRRRRLARSGPLEEGSDS
jgi:apolipoprotein N-acyltransferase